MIIGWCLKNGKIDEAESFYAVRLRDQEQRCPKVSSDREFAERITKYEKALKARNEEFAKYEEQVEKLKASPDPYAYNKAVGSGLLKKPQRKLPTYPKRYEKGEFIKTFPVAFSSHVLRPLIDYEVAGSQLAPEWLSRIGAGLKYSSVRNGIIMIAQQIHVSNKQRYDALRNLLQKMNLPVEDLTFIRAPKVHHVAPVRVKKIQEIKKWWKVGGKLQEEEA
jgi:hypothetical protein